MHVFVLDQKLLIQNEVLKGNSILHRLEIEIFSSGHVMLVASSDLSLKYDG